MSRPRTPWASWTPPQRFTACAAAAIVIGATIAAITPQPPQPPACVEVQARSTAGLDYLEWCLEQVDNWCAINYPHDPDCNNKVYGYDPRPLGSTP